MAGTVNNPKKRSEKLLLRPVAGGKWEAWALDGAPQSAPVMTCATPDEAQPSSQSLLALPVRQLFAVPLWLATSDPAVMRDMIFLQLERRGLAGRAAQDAVFDFRVIPGGGNRTLVLAVALPGNLPPQLCNGQLTRFEPSALTYPLPPDAFTLWLEDERLVLAVTRGREAVYFQALGDRTVTTSVLQELECVMLQLEADEIIADVKTVTAWGAFSATEIDALRDAFGVPVINAPRPVPLEPSVASNLIPQPVRDAQQLEKRSQRRGKLIASVVGIYTLLLLGMLLRAGWFYFQSYRIESDLKANKSVVDEIRTTAHRWDLMEAAIDPEAFPIEQLLRCVKVLPPAGVRFTLFAVNNGKLTIRGEAKDAPAVFTYFDDLKKSRDLQGYRWKMPQPSSLANASWAFQIEGER
jgi:hypothetical protein